MGYRGWFTFTQTAKEALELGLLLDKKSNDDDGVYGCKYVVQLHEPFEQNKLFAVAWGGDGSNTKWWAGLHAKDTRLIDDMDPKWMGNPQKFGTLVTYQNLQELAAAEAHGPLGTAAFEQFQPKIEAFGQEILETITLLPAGKDRMIFLDLTAQIFFLAAVIERNKHHPDQDNARILADGLTDSTLSIIKQNKDDQS